MQDHHHQGHRFSDIDRLRSPERLARLEVDWVVEMALEGAGTQTVLNIGTGTGVFAEAFSQRGKQVTGVDVNPEMLAAASHYVPEGIFQPAPAEALPFPDDSFDLVFMGLVLHETDDLLQALQEAYRVTRLRFAVLEWPYAENDLGDDNVEVELLANGGGVRALTKESEGQADQVEALSKRGVRFIACQNPLDHLNMQRTDLLDLVEVVPAGVSELVKKQMEGWAYIRP